MYGSRFYQQSPIWLQNTLISGRGYVRRALGGSGLNHELDDILRSQRLGRFDMERLQLDRLQKAVQHAAAHVPYYREAFAEAGFSPDQLISLADVARIPILTKDNVRAADKRLIAENATGPKFASTTSGTSGKPLTVRRDLRSINRENAFVWRQCLWAGAAVGDRRVWLRGDHIVPATQTKPPYWRYSKADNTLLMSSYHLSEDRVEDYIRAMEAFDPVFGMAYPSPLVMLARHLLAAGRSYRGRSLRGFVTSSETVTAEQRRVITEAFGCPVFDWYGSSERVTAIGTCEHGQYHILSDYGFTELQPQGDGTFAVIGTAFDNLLMPWIRYELGDSIVPADADYACPCGRVFPVVEQIVGRVEDYVLAADGRHVFMMSNTIDAIPNILEGQILQDSPNEVKILLVSVPDKVVDKVQVIALARQQLGDEMRVIVEQVTTIPRSANGKFRTVIRTI